MTSLPAYDSDQTLQGEPSLSGASNSSMGLTVTFQDVSIRVHGMGEDFGSTCLSVLGDLIPFGKSKKSQRVKFVQAKCSWFSDDLVLAVPHY
ncbi:hypothetical protein CGCTS75_v008173 [Colletotrichum tropicale]|nr:hypothetical protein CGCTS75_v008173 [Colletotrichum tropicale]